MGKFRDFIAAVAGPVSHVFGLHLHCLRFLHLRLCVRRQLLVENMGTFHYFIVALAVAVVHCLCCVWRNTLVSKGPFVSTISSPVGFPPGSQATSLPSPFCL